MVLVFSTSSSCMSPRRARWQTWFWSLFSPSMINPASWPGYGDWVSVPDPVHESSLRSVPSPVSHRSSTSLCPGRFICPVHRRSVWKHNLLVHRFFGRSNPLTPKDIVTELFHLRCILYVLQVKLGHLELICLCNVKLISTRRVEMHIGLVQKRYLSHICQVCISKDLPLLQEMEHFGLILCPDNTVDSVVVDALSVPSRFVAQVLWRKQVERVYLNT